MFYYKLQVGKRAKLFTYKYKEEIEIGSYCMVDFSNKIEKAVIIACDNKNDYDFEIKEIVEVLDERIEKKFLDLIIFMHNYYLEPFSSLVPLIENNTNLDEVLTVNEDYKEYELNSKQQKVLDDIVNSKDLIHLINGVTGSGKTIIYINLIIKALRENKSCIFLVPEISLTPQFLNRLNKTFKSNIAIWHSKLTNKKKEEYKEKLNNGEIKLLLGTRSAIFQNIKNLAYIIIDEEQESTYKQESRPRYHVKNVAIKRCMIENAKLILGSATPNFETIYQVRAGLIKEHKLLSRFNNASLPNIKIVDLNEYNTYLTPIIIEEIRKRLEKKEQVILLLNRKAYSTTIKCLDCKNIMECKNCTYKLTYYDKKKILKCNQCDTTYLFKEKCNKCNSKKIEKMGYGIEKLEENLQELFDAERILRMDSDTMSTNKKIREAYNKFINQEYDILIGTSIIAKGFHFPNVTLVCILNADQMSTLPDFRVQEKSFQLITQAAGRSGREEKKGEVLIQTFNKDADLIKAIINNDYEYMYDTQMKYRQLLNFPPYTKHIKIIVTDKNENRLNKIGNEIYTNLVRNMSSISIIHPISNALIYKVSNRFRKNINIFYFKNNEKNVKRNISNIVNNTKVTVATKILVDVDPASVI